MKKKLLIALVVLLSLISFIMAGWFSLPLILKSKYFISFVEQKTNTHIKKLLNLKISQTLDGIKINIGEITLYNESFKAQAKNISYLLTFSDLISKNPVFGKANIKYLDVKIIPSKEKTKTIIKPLPLSINISHLKAIYDSYSVDGKLHLALKIPKHTNEFSFEGKINSTYLKATGEINNTNLHLQLNIAKFIPTNYPHIFESIKNAKIEGNITASCDFSKIEGLIHINQVSYKNFIFYQPTIQLVNNNAYLKVTSIKYKNMMKANNISTVAKISKTISGKIDIGNIAIDKTNIEKPQITFNYNKTIKKLFIKLKSLNHFNLYANTKIDTNNLTASYTKGYFETPYIDYKQIKSLLPKKISSYIYNGSIKFKKIYFDGYFGDRENIITTGSAVAQNAVFIVEKDTYPFTVTYANIDITSKNIIIAATGYSDKVNIINSKLIIKRAKGYPADINLTLNGEASKNTQDFLYRAILSKEDAKYIDYAKDIRGPFSASIMLKNYYWHPKPNFDFNVDINSHLTLKDEKASHSPITLSGNLKLARIKNILRVSANNLKVQNDASNLTLNGYLESNHAIRYNIKFQGKINPEDIKNITYLKLDKKYLPTTSTDIDSAQIYGNNKRLNFNIDIKGKNIFKEKGFSVDKISAKGYFEDKKISLKALKLDKEVAISGLYNFKSKEFDGEISLNKFNISKIKGLLKLPIDKAILNGNVKCGFKDNKLLYVYSNNFSISDVQYKDITLEKADLIFNKNYATIASAKAKIFDNYVDFNGNIQLKPLILNINATSKKFTMPQNKSKTKNYIGNIKFEIPNIEIHAKAHIDKLIVPNSTPFVFNNVNATLELGKSRYLIIQTPKTNIKITMNDNKIDLKATDSYIFARYIQSQTKKTNFTKITACLTTPNPNLIEIKTLSGTIDFYSKNGNIKDFPDIYKILSLADITGIIAGKVDLKSGFYYDNLVGHFDLKNGILSTAKALVVTGTSNNLFINGSVNLTNYKIDSLFMITTFTTLNHIISYIPIIGYLLGGKEKSFTGLSFRVSGNLAGNLSIFPVPFESIPKGVFDIIKRTLTLPTYFFDTNGK